MSLVNLDLDDLVSFDGSDSAFKSPRSPRSPDIPYYNPIGLTIGETSPASPSRSVASSGAGSASYGRNHAHSVHGVHMHVQENAKVPLLNQSVDRSNSSRRSTTAALPPPPSSSSSLHSAAANSGLSMAELFLNKESKHRQSLNMNYAGLGALLDDSGAAGSGGTGSNSSSRRPSGEFGTATATATAATGTSADDEAQMEIDALTAAIDPTPWSEIERRMIDVERSVAANVSLQHQQQQQQQHQSGAPPYTPHPHQYNYYPYERFQQLPIPERMPSPPQPPAAAATPASQPPESSAVLAQAIATAAALASVEAPALGLIKPATAPPPAPPKAPPAAPPVSAASSSSAALPYTKAQQETTTNNGVGKNKLSLPPPTNPQQYQRRATYSPPQHAVAHSTSRASVLAAANKKSQYGFGGNHVVTSVPAPPPTANTKAYTSKSKSSSLPPPPPSVPTIPSLSVEDQSCNSGAAYERKKQRAKDARIKLNDGIERLSIAMSLAGSQSKQRAKLLSSRISTTEQRPKSLEIFEECANLAEQAKKWDRPSFVGTAASLVQALNSQCESLSREMVFLQERLDATHGTTTISGVPGSVPLPPDQLANQDASSSHPDHKRQKHPTDTIMNGSPAKRMRADHEEEEPISQEANEASATATATATTTQHVDVSADEKTIFGHVAKMLDPISLSRCPYVSRRWRDMNVFDDDSIWFQLAVLRFGFFNVRQWTEKLEDGEANETSVSKKALYRAMNASNVLPHMPHDGLALLGDAKIPGRISGWVFMVERSNGETLRSVKREPSNPAPAGAGVYQSRPVVELHLVIQNTGTAHHPIIIKNQQIAVDVSTRRSGGELREIYWDDRFSKVVKKLDGSLYQGAKKEVQSRYDIQGELCRLGLFETAVINLHIDAKGCSTTSKFRQRSNFTKILVSLEGTTVPMVIPFLRDGSQGH